MSDIDHDPEIEALRTELLGNKRPHDEIARALNWHGKTLTRKKPPVHYIGRKPFYEPEEIAAWLALGCPPGWRPEEPRRVGRPRKVIATT
jgi:hypothetical protein